MVLYARLSQEVGDFITADKALEEVKTLLTPQSELYYWGKYYHVQAKNKVRSLFQQRAYEIFHAGIEFFKNAPKDNEKVRIKFLCKLLEGLGHLMCEPLLFDRADKLLDEAEALYTEHSALFTPLEKFRF